MRNARQVLDETFAEMRWRCLSLAADLDRVQRGDDAPELFETDIRLAQLRQAIKMLLSDASNRAEQVQLIFTDRSPKPNDPESQIQNPK